MDLDELKRTLLSDCSAYIEGLRKCNPGDILLRGYFGKIEIAQAFSHNLNFRKPLHTPENIHNLVNARFETKFGWKIRNGVFCYGFNIRSNEVPKDLGYGPFHICFPIGDFKIVYSPTIIDMYGHITVTKQPIESIINELDYTDETLCEAINSGDRKHQNVGNEISVCVSTYYLVNYKYKDWVDQLVWR